MMTNKKHKILIVDDEEAICKLIQGILQDEGYDVDYKTTYTSAIQAFSEEQYCLSILDVWLHDSSEDGILLMGEFLKQSSSVPIIMMSGHSTVETAVQAIKKGAYDFIEKPFKTDRLLVMVQRALELYSLKNENKNLKSGEKSYDSAQNGSTDTIVGHSSQFEVFRNSLLETAKSLSCALVSGDFGTGKKTAARFIHNQSSRKDQECIVLSCKDSPEESFFGDSEHSNVFAKNSEGSVILDRIEFLPIKKQEELLSFLQNTGSNVATRSRVISTCESDIRSLIKKGLFSNALYETLSITEVNVPTLKERREDIIFLIDMVYSQIKKEDDHISLKMTEDTKTFLMAYTWPGNIKQLKNFTEWMSVSGLGQQDNIILDDVSVYFLELSSKEEGSHVDNSIITFDTCMDVPLKEARQIFEKVYLQEQLMRFNYNISKASGFIGMERSALHRKLRLLDIKTSGMTPAKKQSKRG